MLSTRRQPLSASRALKVFEAANIYGAYRVAT